MKIELVIADVDGTLVTPEKVVTEGTIEAVARLREAGVRFTVTSGRPPRGLARLVELLRITAPVAAFNGGMYVRPDLETVLAQRTVDPEVAREAVDYLLAEGLDVWIYRGPDWFVRRLDAPRVARERTVVGFDPVVTGDLHGLLDAAVKIVGVSEDRRLLARCEAELIARLGSEASAARSASAYVDVTHPEANKGMVVREASRLTGIPLGAIATVGDMLNDVPMLKVAGMGIAMGNAAAEVQRFARHVTLSNEDEGFAHAVDAYILGEPPRSRTPLGLPPRIRACLFRLEGVLTESTALHAETWKELFDYYLRRRAREANQAFVPFDAIRDWAEHFEGRSPPEGVGAFLASRGIELPAQTVEALCERETELFLERLELEGAERYEGTLRFVKAARGAGLITGVVSASRFVRATLEAAGLAGELDAVFAGLTVSDGGQPTPEAWVGAAGELGFGPDEVAVFEASPAGLASARAAHAGYLVGVDRLEQEQQLRSAGADVVVADPIDLSPGLATRGRPAEEVDLVGY